MVSFCDLEVEANNKYTVILFIRAEFELLIVLNLEIVVTCTCVIYLPSYN